MCMLGCDSNCNEDFLLSFLTLSFSSMWFVDVIQTLRITAVGVEVRQPKTGDLHWCLDFRDMDSPGIILLADAYGRKGVEGGGFVLCPLYGRKCKAFIAASGVSNSAILSKLVSFLASITCRILLTFWLCYNVGCF